MFPQEVVPRTCDSVHGGGLLRSYIPSSCATDVLADCDAPSNYFGAMLDTHFYWQDTWRREGRMQLSLPARPVLTSSLARSFPASQVPPRVCLR